MGGGATQSAVKSSFKECYSIAPLLRDASHASVRVVLPPRCGMHERTNWSLRSREDKRLHLIQGLSFRDSSEPSGALRRQEHAESWSLSPATAAVGCGSLYYMKLASDILNARAMSRQPPLDRTANTILKVVLATVEFERFFGTEEQACPTAPRCA